MSFRPGTLECHRHAIRSVIEVMRSDASAPFDLKAMAATAHMSLFHFLRVFEETTQISPARFRASLRIERAKRMLLCTSLPVTAICFESGYNSLGTFTRLFTDSVGVSPSLFRKLGEAHAGDSLDALSSDFRRPPRQNFRPAISGSVRAPAGFDGVIFLGVFASPIPRQRPLSGGLIPHQGRFELSLDEDDRPGCLMAAGFPANAGSVSYLLPSDGVLVASAPLPRDSSGRPREACDLLLRSMEPFDPPILTALPILLADYQTDRDSQSGRSAFARARLE
jgi:AraC family transcriptional regulator